MSSGQEAWKAIALPVGLDDVNAVRESVEQRTGEALVTEYLGPLLEGEIRGDEYTLQLVSTAQEFKEQLGVGFGERDIAEFVKDEQVRIFDAL